MKTRLAFLIIFSICVSLLGNTSTQDYQVNKISDKIFVFRNPAGGENQLVIASEKGLVVLNTFWSEIIAEQYKKEIAKALNRDDFSYTINMVDRLDMFGGNAAYKETTIIGHRAFWDKYKGKEDEVTEEINRLIEMWRWKEDVSRERLEKHEPGSERAINEQRWMNTCKQRADELEDGFSLVLPAVVYNDRMTLNLGDITLKLIWFGKAGYDGMTVMVIPEENLAIIPGFILHSHHLAPHPQGTYAELDVPRWINVLEEILEGGNSIESVVCDNNNVWSKQRALTHLEYIRKLWNRVKIDEAAKKDINEIKNELSLDRDFSFVKEMQVYNDGGDDWIRPQHQTHVKLFFLQHKNLASEIINKEMKKSSLQGALTKVRNLRDSRSDIYFDEASINGLGYNLLNSGKISEAIEIFNLNVEVFPGSSNVYDSLAEAYMKNGDKKLAIKNYKKSLKLNSNNTNAIDMLKKINEQ